MLDFKRITELDNTIIVKLLQASLDVGISPVNKQISFLVKNFKGIWFFNLWHESGQPEEHFSMCVQGLIP